MRRRARLILLAVVAAGTALLGLAGTAAAATLNLAPAGAVTLRSLGRFALTGTSGFIDITLNCNISLTGTLDRAIADAPGSQLGAISGGTADICDNGSADLLFTDPSTWRLTVQSVDLSNKQVTVLLHDFRFSYTITGITCLFEGDIPLALSFSGAGPYTTGLAVALTHSLDLASGGFLCPTTAEGSVTFAVTPQTLTLS